MSQNSAVMNIAEYYTIFFALYLITFYISLLFTY
jgi:hypothetical protein